MKNWQEIRSTIDPSTVLPHGDNDPILVLTHKEASPFGQEEKEVTFFISSNEKELHEYFLEIVLREMLFEDYVNGDAVPELQKLNFQDVLSILLEGAKKGELDDWHDGYSTLLLLKEWSKKEPNKSAYEELDDFLAKHDLNLRVEYFSSKEEAKKKHLELD